MKKIGKRCRILPSYTNSVVCEWLGSHIYAAIGFPVQETMLGHINNGKPAVACRHIYDSDNGEVLVSLRQIIDALDESIVEKYFDSKRKTRDINKLSKMFKELEIFSNLNFNEYFWDIFIIDALIANPDRNQGNIGIIIKKQNNGKNFVCTKGTYRIAPVYDNGSSFNCRMEEYKMKNILSKFDNQSKSTFLHVASPYLDGKKNIDATKYIYENPSNDCIAAIGRIVPKIDMKKCVQPILKLKQAGIISKTQTTFYIASMNFRYRKVLLPAYEKYFGPLQSHKNKIGERQDTKKKSQTIKLR